LAGGLSASQAKDLGTSTRKRKRREGAAAAAGDGDDEEDEADEADAEEHQEEGAAQQQQQQQESKAPEARASEAKREAAAAAAEQTAPAPLAPVDVAAAAAVGGGDAGRGSPEAAGGAAPVSRQGKQMRGYTPKAKKQPEQSPKGAEAGGGGGGGGGGASTAPAAKGGAKKKWFEEDEPAGRIDYTDGNAAAGAAARRVESVQFNEKEEEEDEEEDEEEAAAEAEGKGGEPQRRGFFSFLSGLVSGEPLSEKQLEPVLRSMKELLMRKNVAADIADQLCRSVQESLVGKTVGTFTSVRALVKKTMEDALTRILTPKKSVDILQGVARAQSEGRPYTIVFVGVNGVGKSTSLAKLCAYLLFKGLKVSIAACDTFRAGAVEQLRTHATCLNVPLYDRGYGKDASAVAAEAVRQARKEGHDVVLVDTAGRMQDNHPLMVALSKLINENKPDLVLFVGEALVGNDAVDQLTKFNKCLADLSTGGSEPRLIDGIVLTKFDTIDDKVGAAISMTFTTGQPIMFVGCGQQYSDLKRMNVKLLIKALLK
jgi:signal recognition particle receptor subunit alpha